LTSLFSPKNLMALIVFILLVIVFWEVVRGLLRGIFRRLAQSSHRSPSAAESHLRKHEQQVWQARREKFLQDLKNEAAALMSQGQMANMLIKDRVLKETREEAERILRQARGQAEQIRIEVLTTIQKDIAEMIFSLNQHWTKNSADNVHSERYPRAAHHKAIEKYLDSYHALKTPRTSSLL